MKVAARNNLLRKLSNSKWGTNANTIRTTSLVLCYYVAEYAAPVERSSHAQKLNPKLNSACRAVTGCPKPTNVEDLYLLPGIAPPDIRRDVRARVEKTKQETYIHLYIFDKILPSLVFYILANDKITVFSWDPHVIIQ